MYTCGREIYVQTLQKEYVRKKRQLLTSPLTRDRLDKHLQTHVSITIYIVCTG